MENLNQKGLIFNIQRFSVHDGSGIRTIIFLKGCPLRCQWCANPESQNSAPEIGFNPSRCLGPEICGACAKVCPSRAISIINDTLNMDRKGCMQCFACVRECPGGAHTGYGEWKSIIDILKIVEKDDTFYGRSGGGLTLSGGEPLLQEQFALSLLKEARKRHINTAMETCGAYNYKRLANAASFLDELFYDIKCFNSARHKEFTGSGNKGILENLGRVHADFPNLPICVRTPLIPGFNDNTDEIRAILDFIPRDVKYELLPYHRFGEMKYSYLGRKYALQGRELSGQRLEQLNLFVKEHRKTAQGA